MSLRLPIALHAEYRGRAPGGSFIDEDGKTVEYTDALKFEVELPDGDVDYVVIRLQALDRCEPPFDGNSLDKGDEVILTGVVVLQSRGSGRDSYFKPMRCEAAGAHLKAAVGA